MKIQSIGDIHGNNAWQDLVDLSCDKIIFVGDYVDEGKPFFDEEGKVTFKETVSDAQIYNNLVDILEFKNKYPDKIILLYGNHDVQYFLGMASTCSGLRPSMRGSLYSLFSDNEDLFQVAWEHNNVLITHAGITQTYYDRFLKKALGRFGITITEYLNYSLRKPFIHNIGTERGGTDVASGPLWAGKNELKSDPLKGYIQIVGHTAVKDIEQHVNLSRNSSVYFVDTLNFSQNVLTLTI